MARIFGRQVPDWALYAGGGLALGGGYLLYKKRKAASSSGGASTTTTPAVSTVGADQQQSSIAPYYLTGNQGQTGYQQPGSQMPMPVPTTIIGADNSTTATTDTSSGVASSIIPSIPPLLPISPPAPPAPPPTTTLPAPVPAPGGPVPTATAPNQNIPSDLLARIESTGERIVKSIPAPGGGTWYLGSYGGVFSIGGAPFFGSARPYGFGPGAPRTAIDIQPLGRGYRVVSSRGENYDFPG